MSVSVCVGLWLCVSVCVCVSMFVCVFVCMCVSVYMCTMQSFYQDYSTVVQEMFAAYVPS